MRKESRLSTTLRKIFEAFLETLWRKKGNAGNQHFLLIPQCFLPFQRKNSSFESPLIVVCKCLDEYQCLSYGITRKN